MPPLLIVIFAVAGWIALVLSLRWAGVWFFSRGPGGDPVTGLMVWGTQVYCHLMHRVRYEGLKHVPPTNQPGALVVVCNHTSPTDPLRNPASWLSFDSLDRRLVRAGHRDGIPSHG